MSEAPDRRPAPRSRGAVAGRALAMIIAAGAVLVLADRVLQPVPLGAALATAAALAAIRFTRSGWRGWVALGFLGGLAADAGRHVLVHRAGAAPPEGLPAHLALDLAVAGSVAALALAAAWAIGRFAGQARAGR